MGWEGTIKSGVVHSAVHFVLLNPTILQKFQTIKKTHSVIMENTPQTDNGTLTSAALITCPAWGPKSRGGASTEQAEAKWYPVTKVRGYGGRAEKNIHTLHMPSVLSCTRNGGCYTGQLCRSAQSVFKLTRVPFLSTALLYTLILHAPQLSSHLFCVHS